MRFSFSHNRCCRCLGASKQWCSFGRWKCMLLLPERVTRKCMWYMPQNLWLDPKNADFIFNTHMYHEHSTKSMESSGWGCGEELTELRRRTQGSQGTGKMFLSTAHRKKIISVLLEVWGSDQFASKLKSRHVMWICDGAFLLHLTMAKRLKSQKSKHYHHCKKKPIERWLWVW